MKASKEDIKFYKGVILIQIHDYLTKEQTFLSLEELDNFLKDYADLFGISCSDMTHNEMQELKEYSKQFAMSVGLDLDKDNGINLNF